MTKKSTNFRLPEGIADKLDELAAARNKSLTATIIDLIEAGNFESENRYKFLDDKCPLLYYLSDEEAPKTGEGFYCLEKSPKATKLGSGIAEAAKKYCEACQFKKGVIDENKTMTKQLKQGYTVKIPFCVNGGKVSEDLQKIWCPIITARRPVQECKTLRKGANCKHLRWITAEATRPQTSDKT